MASVRVVSPAAADRTNTKTIRSINDNDIEGKEQLQRREKVTSVFAATANDERTLKNPFDQWQRIMMKKEIHREKSTEKGNIPWGNNRDLKTKMGRSQDSWIRLPLNERNLKGSVRPITEDNERKSLLHNNNNNMKQRKGHKWGINASKKK